MARFSKARTLLILLLASPLSGLAAGTAFPPRQALQHVNMVEWTVPNSVWQANPFDVDARVTFSHQSSGAQRTTAMFYRGDRTWAFRFTGTRPGVWTFVSSSTDEDLHGHTGRITVKPNPDADAHGFLRKFGNKWGWEGTNTAFVPQLVQWDYIVGDSSPKYVYDNPALIDEKIGLFLAGHGFNGFHVPVIAGRWFDLDAPSDRVTSGMTDPDPRTFAALERLIIRTHRAGGMVHIWPWGDHQRRQTPRSLPGGLGGHADVRLQRYMAARLGPIPGWSMGFGFDLDEWVTAAEVRAWRDRMHGLMGWHHFLGGRPAGPNRGMNHRRDAIWNRGLDYSSYEHHRPTYAVYRAALQAMANQPVMSEDRFRVRPPKYPEKDYTLERTRRGLYHATLAGGVANIWGIHPDSNPGGVYPNRHQIKTYAVFFHQMRRFLRDMDVANELSTDDDTYVLLSRETGSLVLYREDAEAIQIDTSSLHVSRAALAVDTRKPYREIKLGALEPGAQTIPLPAVSDWVVAVGPFRTLDSKPSARPTGTSASLWVQGASRRSPK